jgi:tetratricopeptide (TPR) repeat protein
LADIGKIAAYEVTGLYAEALGDSKAALASFQHAATIEAKTPPCVSQPAFLPPANELLGWQLLDRGQYAKAREAFAVALQLTPNRRNAILGMAKASVLP